MKILSYCPFFWKSKTFLIMKMTTLLLTVNLMQITATTFSQSTRFDLSFEQTPLKEALNTIENQSTYKFVYRESDIENKTVTLTASDLEIVAVLDGLLSNTENHYRILENNLVIIASNEVLQQNRITGTITDGATGEPLIGVNVSIEGTQGGTITDVSGKFTINATAGDVLVFSYIGYLSEKVVVENQTTVDLQMMPDIQELEEVVVVGYGTQRKSDVTGSVSSVSSKEMALKPVNNVFEAMQGKAAGVDITTKVRPGEIGEIRIRGERSITGKNDPLYVVDGIPVNSTSGIETLNPQDIEAIDILKDASATAIYGSRGANGVVLVTTKRGSAGKLTLNYSGSVTSQKLIWRSEYMNAAEFIDFVRWGSYNQAPASFARGDEPSLENDRNIALFTADPVALANIERGWEGGSWDPSRLQSFDWMDQVIQPNIAHEHTLSGSGGTDKMKAYGSIGYLSNQGTTKGQEYQRYTVRTSMDLTPKDWFQFGAGLNATWSFQDYGQSNEGSSMTSAGDLIASAAKIYPYALPYDDNGELIDFPGGQSRVSTIIDEWKYSTNQRELLRIIGSLFAEVKIIEGLKYRINFGPDYRNYRKGIYNDGKSVTRGGSSFGEYSGDNDFSWTLDNLLYYDKLIGQHKIGVTLLQTASSWRHENYRMNGQNLATDTEKWYALGTLSSLDRWETGLTERQLVSYMGRVNYGFADKYLITISGRWDGASQLAVDHKWSFFPSLAIGWRIDQEEFMKNLNVISQLKMRLGFGETGNAAIDPYTTKGAIDLIQQPYGGDIVTGYAPTTKLANVLLGWETTKQYNVGIDFGLFRNRINGTLDFYATSTTDLLLNVNLPTTSGYKNTTANIGETKNSGFEITLNSINVQNNGFTWDTRLTAGWQKDKIVSLMNGKEDMVGSGDYGGWFIDESIKSWYDYEHIGLWQDTPEDQAEMALFNANGHDFEPGMIRVRDLNNDHRIDANYDKKIIGNVRPRWTVGFRNTFSYKNLELSLFISGRLKYKVRVGEGLTGMFGDQRKLDYWTPNNTDAEYQKPFRNEAGGDPYSGTYIKDDSYLKISSISLGYNLPGKIVNKLKISNLRAYVQSNNTGMLWSNNTFRDAEFGTLYYNRGLVFGVDIGF